MAIKEFPAGEILFQSEQPVTSIHLITRGTVQATYPGGSFQLTKGDVIGICELHLGSYYIAYQTTEPVSLAPYPCSKAQLSDLMSSNVEMSGRIIFSLYKQLRAILDQYEQARTDCDQFYHYLMDSYAQYSSFCTKHGVSARALPGLETLSELVLDEDVPDWLGGYYAQFLSLVKNSASKKMSSAFMFGLLSKANDDIHQVISICRILYDYKADLIGLLMNENRLDLFDFYAGLLYRIGSNEADSTALQAVISDMMVQLESHASIDHDMYEKRVSEYHDRLHSLSAHTGDSTDAAGSSADIIDSLNTILSYSQVDEETAFAFKVAVEQFRKMTDKNSSDDSARKLRQKITKLFYDVYEKAFLRSLHDESIPKVVKMFFNFGYVDEQLAGMKNAAYLCSIVDYLPTDPSKGLYTLYEWLLAIYKGKKSPSRNEFDTDYQAYVHELKTSGKITAAEETTMLGDNEKMVLFELQSVFPSINKITFGRISSFCPVFSEHNILKDLDTSLVSVASVEEAFNHIRSVDFSAYYRDTIYTNADLGIAKEYISVEVLPDIILMPNMGIRGVMWQEIEGRKRTTPSRMMVSIFQMEDLTNIFIRLTADFRWEMCKRIQGPRWNDVTEPSLTSEYFDYIQFYKKNHELSTDAKEKIKLSMQKAKNSFKEMFIRDYESWVLYEGAGSPRLNKIARAILFSYCPFSKGIRDTLKANPLYKETMERYDVKLGQRLHHYNNLFQKIKNSGAPIPPEIQAQKEFLEY
ncbi:MAG: hypothetical protein K1W10_11170 [Lachnospiraceae bacterium]